MSGAVLLSVYETDGETFIAHLPQRRNPRWLDEGNADGGGSFEIHADADVLAAHPTLLAERNVVKVKPVGHPDYVFSWRITGVNPVEVSSGEDPGRWVKVDGPGIRTVCGDAVIWPEQGVRERMADTRSFDANAEDGPWRIPAEWTAPLGVRQDADTTARAGNPPGWPDPAAQWLWPTNPLLPAAVGRCWFRASVVLAADTEVTLYASSDNNCAVYLDGEVVLASDPDVLHTWRETMSYSTVLDAGTHWITAWVDNKAAAVGTNPAGFLFTMATLLDSGEIDTVLLRSTPATFIVKAYGDPPGWTAALIMLTLLAEAQARGVSSLAAVVPDFTGTLDSDGNGWVDIQDRQARVSSNMLDEFDSLAELVLDFEVTPAMVLRAWKRRGTDRSATVHIQPNRDLTEHSPSANFAVRNVALVRHANGWVEVEDAASVAAHGRVETGITAGNAQSAGQATAVGEAAFDETAEPTVTLPFTWTSAAGPQPYLDFWMHDIVDVPFAPVLGGGRRPARVMSIAGAESADGSVLNWQVNCYPGEAAP